MLRATILIFAAGCASVGRSGSDASFARHEVIATFVRWREGERRRDPDMAQEALYFERSSDRAFHREELNTLSGVFAGPIRTAQEVHLIGHPDPLGPGDYLFLEPAGRAYGATFVTIRAVNGKPRVLYRRPAVSQKERLSMSREELLRALIASHIAFWESLRDERLAAEVERTKRKLRYEVTAERYAREHSVPLASFAPSPDEILRALEPLPPPAARQWIVAALK